MSDKQQADPNAITALLVSMTLLFLGYMDAMHGDIQRCVLEIPMGILMAVHAFNCQGLAMKGDT